MSFVGTPACFRMDIPFFDWDLFWFDKENDLRLLRWTAQNDSREYCIVSSDNIMPRLRVNGISLVMQTGLVNGQPWFSNGNQYIFRSANGDWILHTSLVEPSAYQLSNNGAWKGDGWWRLTEFDLEDFEANILLVAQGLYLNEEDAPSSTPVVTWFWPRWIRDASKSGSSRAPFGLYIANKADMDPARRVVGCMRFRPTQDGRRLNGYWIESFDGSCFVNAADGTTQTLAQRDLALWATEGWSKDGVGTWLQTNTPPTRADGASLIPMRRRVAGEGAIQYDKPITLQFVDYVTSGMTETIHMAEVALWR